jgi:hypothetical protein
VLEVTIMSDATVRAAGTRWARCVRWLGLDRNPLRRPADRIEAAVRLTTAMLILVAVPIAALAAGQRADHMFLRDTQARQAADHQVSAVLTEDVPASSTATDPYVTVQTTWAPARWTAPDGSAHSGQVLVPAGASKGTKTPIWINASGVITDPPAGHLDVVAEVSVTVMVTSLGLIIVLLSGLGLTRRALDRRRLSAWEAEWRAVGPLWTGRRT